MKTIAGLLLLPLAVSACGGSPGSGNETASSSPTAVATANASQAAPAQSTSAALPAAVEASVVPTTAMPTGILSCRADIGPAAAARLVETCRNVSPATHPPCNAANSCAMIADEVARSCALADGNGPPMKGCTTDPGSTDGAADVVRRYYSAINARDYATAWSQWFNGGQPGRTFASFQAGFARTRGVRVEIGASPPIEGAAGSSYVEVPVTVDTTLADGAHQRFTGSYVMRAINDVDGATPEQLGWHIYSAKLKQAPTP